MHKFPVLFVAALLGAALLGAAWPTLAECLEQFGWDDVSQFSEAMAQSKFRQLSRDLHPDRPGGNHAAYCQLADCKEVLQQI
jgi:hypothetical protein